MPPPQEKLAALAEKWRKFANGKRTTEFGHGSANAYREVADELESLLSEHGGGGEAVLSAKPLEWKEEAPGWWSDASMGFNIEHNTDPDEAPENRYTASWGEGDSEHFATMDEAKAWCQELADGWVRDCGQITTPPTPSAPAEYMRHPSGDGTIVRKDDPSRRLSVDEILAAMRGPSAPVVDESEIFAHCTDSKGNERLHRPSQCRVCQWMNDGAGPQYYVRIPPFIAIPGRENDNG